MDFSLQTPLEYLSGVGSATIKLLHKLNLKTIGDLLSYYPRKYDDFSDICKINKLSLGLMSIKAVIKQVNGRYVRGGLHITEAIAEDDTGSVRLVWFNQPYRSNSIKHYQKYFISGVYELKNNRMLIVSPSIELESDLPINTARILPIYRETKGLNSRQIRKLVSLSLKNLPQIEETLPVDILKTQGLISRKSAITYKHFPKSIKQLNQANERLGFEELFELILSAQFSKSELQKCNGTLVKFNQSLAKKFTKSLPFKLTNSQKQIAWQIILDMQSGKIMNRLLEGDVGTGKTIVAVMSALMALNSGKQVALMVPTELLARQHYKTITKIFASVGFEDTVLLLVSSLKKPQKDLAIQQISSGKPKFVIGTHSLIQEGINLNELALIIVDEQHRFGVAQRQKLLSNKGQMPHMLSMTATPIPRSLALTIFGELDISILTEKPSQQLPIETKLIHPNKRLETYNLIEQQLKIGRQAFVVCPVIEESEVLKVKSAKQTYNELTKIFKDYKVSLLHGKQNSLDNQAIMKDFANKKIDILVATTMVEVGVDVPNASIMVVESPERFGLAQLHQLRGRIGRGKHQGYCYLMLSDGNSVTSRLKALESTNDGFKLAELDLKIRGAGALYGTTQHGVLDLKIADFTDSKLISRARESALEFLSDPNNLLQYPYIRQRITKLQSVVHLN